MMIYPTVDFKMNDHDTCAYVKNPLWTVDTPVISLASLLHKSFYMVGVVMPRFQRSRHLDETEKPWGEHYLEDTD